jgi:hypothetical protein
LPILIIVYCSKKKLLEAFKEWSAILIAATQKRILGIVQMKLLSIVGTKDSSALLGIHLNREMGKQNFFETTNSFATHIGNPDTVDMVVHTGRLGVNLLIQKTADTNSSKTTDAIEVSENVEILSDAVLLLADLLQPKPDALVTASNGVPGPPAILNGTWETYPDQQSRPALSNSNLVGTMDIGTLPDALAGLKQYLQDPSKAKSNASELAKSALVNEEFSNTPLSVDTKKPAFSQNSQFFVEFNAKDQNIKLANNGFLNNLGLAAVLPSKPDLSLNADTREKRVILAAKAVMAVINAGSDKPVSEIFRAIYQVISPTNKTDLLSALAATTFSSSPRDLIPPQIELPAASANRTESNQGSKFLLAITDQIKSANITNERSIISLTPNGLGKLEIEIHKDIEGRMQIVLRTESSAVLSAFRNDREAVLQSLSQVTQGGRSANLDFQEFSQQSESHHPQDVDKAQQDPSLAKGGIDDATTDHKQLVARNKVDIIT